MESARRRYITCFLLVIPVVKITATHNVVRESTGTVYLNLTGSLGDFTDWFVECVVTGGSGLDFEMKWEVAKQNNPAYYFDIDRSKQPDITNKSIIVSSIYLTRWKEAISYDERKNASGVIYAEADHVMTQFHCGETNLFLQWIPVRATISPLQTTVRLGNRLNLQCSSDDKGSPTGIVKWTTPTGVIDGEDNLIIETVTAQDGGRYRCVYSNDIGQGGSSQNASVTVITKWQPNGSTEITGKPDLPVERANNYSLKCDLSLSDRGEPAGSVKWTLNNTATSHTGIIVNIINVSYDNVGEWRCKFTNAADEGPVSDPVPVTLGWRPAQAELDVDIDSPSGNLTLGSEVTLKCLSNDKGIPTGSVEWNRKDNGITYEKEIITLQNLTHDDNGTWQCYYVNKFGTGTRATRPINILWNISDPSLGLSLMKVTDGEDVILNCSLNDSGNPPATIQWFHNNTLQTGYSESDFVITIKNVQATHNGIWICSVTNGLSPNKNDSIEIIVMTKAPTGLQMWVYIIIAVVAAILVIVIIVIIVVVTKKKKKKKSDTIEGTRSNDQYAYNNKSFDAKTGTGHYDASKTNAGAEGPVYSVVSKGKPLAPIADGAVYSQVDLSKKTSRQSMKGLPMSKKAIDRIIFHKKDGYVNMAFQVRKKFAGDIEIGVCRVGDQSCTSKVSKQHDGASKDVVMVLPIEDSSPDNYSIHIKFIERGQVTQTVDLTYPYNKNAVNVTVLNNVYGTNVSPSYADVEVEGVPPRPPRQGAPGEGVTYAVMDWNRSQAPGRPPRLSARSPAQEHVEYADVRPGGNVY